MILRLVHRLVLGFSAVALLFIGLEVLLSPVDFHASNGIELSRDPSLLSEVRAPAGLLVLAGVFLAFAAVRARRIRQATILGAAVYLSYGAARLVALAFDGPPSESLLLATAIEFLLGGMLVAFHLLSSRDLAEASWSTV